MERGMERHDLEGAEQLEIEIDDADDDDISEVEDPALANDTTAEEAQGGRDIQGIPWERLQFSREGCREHRLQQYKNYKNLEVEEDVLKELERECKKVVKGARLYDFHYNTRRVRSFIVHFQLRNLVWATSSHDVYLKDEHSINHWSPVSGRLTEVMDLRSGGHAAHGLGRVQVSTMCVKNDLLVVGGFSGELVGKRLSEPTLAFSGRISQDENAITNALEIYEAVGGGARVMSSNNDAMVRVFDAEGFQPISRFQYPWAVNYATVSPDGKLACVVGDNPAGLLIDSRSGQVLCSLQGHLDYSFAAAWHPDGRVLATGNQDATTRVWDVRYLGGAVAVIKARMGAVRSLRFSDDGRFLAMSEPADFVHVLDVKSDYTRSQEVDLFGEVSGVAFSPGGGDALFVGVADHTYNSLLHYDRFRPRPYLDVL